MKIKYKQIFSRRILFECLFFAISLAVVCLCLSVVARLHGWPIDDDLINLKLRTEIYAQHFRYGDFLPNWSSSDGYGLGTPMPLFYQKLFYYVAGVVFIALDNAIKSSLMVSIGIFMLIGVYGMRLAISQMTDKRPLILLAPQTLLLCNYSFTDWFMRGDVAEFSAMMLVPWVFYWCINLIKNKKASWIIVPLLVLLVLAHNAIAIAAIIMLIVASICYIYGRIHDKSTIRIIRNVIVSALIFTAILSPLFVVQYKMSKDFDTSAKILQDGGIPTNHFLPAKQYIYSHYSWLKTDAVLDFQIDYGIWMPIAVLTLTGLYLTLFKKYKKARIKFLKLTNNRVFVFLVITFFIYCLLQLKISTPIYDVLTPLKYLQFPWRLLIFITISGLLIVTTTLDWLYDFFKKEWLASALVIVWLLVFLGFSPIIRHFATDYPTYPTSNFSAAIPANYYGGVGVIGSGEYFPKMYNSAGQELTKDQEQAYYNMLLMNHQEGQTISGSCTYSELPQSSFEVLQQNFQINCSKPSRFALPITYSRYIEVYKVNTDGSIVTYSFYRIKTDPRVLVNIDHSVELRVVFPTFIHVLTS